MGTDDLRHGSRSRDSHGMSQLLTRLKDARKESGKPLNARETEALAKAGVSDFSRARFLPDMHLSRLRAAENTAFDFSGADIKGAAFTSCDLRRANFRRAELTYTRFMSCDTSSADFSEIVIEGEPINLLVGEAHIPAASLSSGDQSDAGIVRTCPEAEERYQRIFGEWSAQEPFQKARQVGEGIVLVQKKEVIGVLKLFLEHSMLATQTTRAADGSIICWEGGLYALSRDFAQFLMVVVEMNRPRGAHRAWPVVDLDEALTTFRAKRGEAVVVEKTLLRFLRNRNLFDRLPDWNRTLEGSQNNITLTK